MYIFIVLVGVLMYSILYKLGLKVYDNLYGRTLLAMLLFQPIILVGLILSEYLLSDSGYSITSEFLVSFFNILDSDLMSLSQLRSWLSWSSKSFWRKTVSNKKILTDEQLDLASRNNKYLQLFYCCFWYCPGGIMS